MKKSVIGRVLLGLGAFLLAMAAISYFWAPGVIEKTPIEVDTKTVLEGTAKKLNFSTQELEDLEVQATSITRSDTDKSDDDVTVFVSTTCLVNTEGGEVPDCVDGKDSRLLSASTDTFATDRDTALPVQDEKYIEEQLEPKEGLINKFPFGVEKKSYDMWDGMTGMSFPATFEGVEDFKGLETYKFNLTIDERYAQISDGVDGLYSTEKDYWVDPVTGSIINQTQHEIRKLPAGDLVLDLDIEFNDATSQRNVDDAEDNIFKINLFKMILPLVGLIGGLVFLVLGALLLLRGRRGTEGQHRPKARETVSLGK